MKLYKVIRESMSDETRGEVRCYVRDADGSQYRLRHEPSLKVFNHSPAGFEFGYGGSGPAQLALAILLDLLHPSEKDFAVRLHQDFKSAFIADKQDDFEITEDEIREWIRDYVAVKA